MYYQMAMLEVVFKFQIQTILQSALESSEIEAMLTDLEHEAWESPENETIVARYLTTPDKVACIDAIDNIMASLEAVDSLIDELDGILVRDPPPNAQKSSADAMKKWKERVLASLEACSLAKRIKGGIADVEKQISHLTQIVTEAEKCLQSSIRGPITSEEEKAWRGESQNFSLTQNASRALFEALKSTCQSHQHSFHLTLNPRVNKSGSFRADFEMALQHDDTDRCASNDWLLICSSSTATTISARSEARQDSARKQPHPLLAAVNESRKRARSPESSTRRHRDTVKDNLDNSVAFTVAPNLERPLRNLSQEMFLCQYIALLSRQPCCNSEKTTIGFFSSGPGYKHLVYLLQRDFTQHKFELQQLGDILARSTTTIPERVKLARYLAQAVLHFATNPWLSNGWWTLKDIAFFVDPLRLQASEFIEKPYITTKVGASKQPLSGRTGSKVSNPLLFNLAIIMIEIALGRSLRAPRALPDETLLSADPDAHLKTAIRLTNNLGSTLGRRYRKAVEHCLNQSQDIEEFDNQDAQKDFFFRVVHPLRMFERELEI